MLNFRTKFVALIIGTQGNDDRRCTVPRRTEICLSDDFAQGDHEISSDMEGGMKRMETSIERRKGGFICRVV